MKVFIWTLKKAVIIVSAPVWLTVLAIVWGAKISAFFIAIIANLLEWAFTGKT